MSCICRYQFGTYQLTSPFYKSSIIPFSFQRIQGLPENLSVEICSPHAADSEVHVYGCLYRTISLCLVFQAYVPSYIYIPRQIKAYYMYKYLSVQKKKFNVWLQIVEFIVFNLTHILYMFMNDKIGIRLPVNGLIFMGYKFPWRVKSINSSAHDMVFTLGPKIWKE